VQAFAHGVLDYLVKPVEIARLADTVARLKERLAAAQPASNTDAILQQLSAQIAQLKNAAAKPAWLRWVRAQIGQTLRMIPVDEIDYLRSDTKYTRIAWRGDGGQAGEALVRLPLKELVAQLDPAQFAQVHRSVVVNLAAISHVTRGDNETADIHLRGRRDVLPVSRSFLHLFRQM
ncbi:MAG TPA: LytTR family DNA-binding domain-containing protein, partial [Tahibacter sp.]|nr:LytTR family DNA-binding domain-containing protein [Tahibacter sp.]